MKIYIDGKLVEEADARISVFDHGLLYGDGVFEGIRFYQGTVFELEEHIERLYDSARAICLEIPLSRQGVTDALLETIRANELRDGYVRLLVTRGVGTLGLDPNHCETATVIIIASSISLYPKEYYSQGLKLITCATRRPTPAALSPAVKSLNYLNNVMAKIEALNAGAVEGIMLNEQGYVAECTGDNIFVAKRGAVYTPPISSGALNGITRRVLIEILEELDIPCKEMNMTRYEVYTADECFLTGTAAEVIPAVMLDTRPIGDGVPGPITAKCTEKYHERTLSCGVPIYG